MGTELNLAEKSALSTYVISGGAIRKGRANGDGPPWGKANPLRGKGYHGLACAFIQTYPVGSRLTQAEFCKWANATLSSPEFQEWTQDHPDVFVNMPRPNEPKTSDAWHAHLSRRHRLRFNLNKAAAHPRMTETGYVAFVIASDGSNWLEVRIPPVEVVRKDDLERIKATLVNKRRQYNYLMQSADWNALDALTTREVERVYEQIEDYLADMEKAGFRLNRACVKADEALKAIGIGVPPVALAAPDIDEPENGDMTVGQ